MAETPPPHVSTRQPETGRLIAPQRALVATFAIAGDPISVLSRATQSMSDACTILPLTHDRASHNGVDWTATALILGNASALEAGAEHLLDARPETLRRLALMTMQPGLDMLFAKHNGRAAEQRMIQWIEYVSCDPAAREDYYRCQSEVSGPAMRSLWDRGLVARFMGFEEREVLYSSPGFPAWDVLHVIGMTPWQLLRFLPRMCPAFDRFAKAAGRGSRRAMFEQWGHQRTLVKLTAKQPLEVTRHASAEQDGPAPPCCQEPRNSLTVRCM
ncbi:hypothetical protein ACLBKT_14935 [Erythrobacter sp. W302b]|uniref:hypothetical protein n=1 Tax=Erythrobacter sp. W302b TaxID=3389874 RepID=UPI00396B1510